MLLLLASHFIKEPFLLQRLKRVEKAHSTFITGLEFLPTSEETEVIRGFSDVSAVSISVDNQVCIHHVPRLSKIRKTVTLFMSSPELMHPSLFSREDIYDPGLFHPSRITDHHLYHLQLHRSLNEV